MENWRESVVEVLRECNGESNLEEIYDKIEHLIPDLNIDWKAGTRRTLETNSSDSEAWNGKHDLFENKHKGSGKWNLKINYFRDAILNLNTKFYFLTTGKYEHRDIDYKIYTWNKRKNNKLKSGDIFIYRVPQKVSSNKKFFFFGAGQIGSIFNPKIGDPQYQREGDMCASIINPIHFENPIYESELKPADLGINKDDWSHSFDQYGIQEITLDKFLFLLNKGTGENLNNESELNEIKIKAHQNVIKKDYSFPDKEAKTTSSRGAGQEYFRESLILPNYQFRCAITGIKTKSLLTAAHIMSWADHPDIRLNPKNGICLSKLVDKCFEDYLIFINEEFKIVINDEVKKDKELFDQLKKFEGEKIFLPINKENYPDKEYLRLHMERKNKKIKQ